MRIKESIEQIAYLRQAASREKLEHVFGALDVLGSTAWMINRDVFDVALQVWNSGEALADIPPKSLPVALPVRPVDAAVNLKTQARYEEDLQRAAALQRNNHSQRCGTNYKMEIARAVRPLVSTPFVESYQNSIFSHSSLAKSSTSPITSTSVAGPTRFRPI